jgi:hypothetical protein
VVVALLISGLVAVLGAAPPAHAGLQHEFAVFSDCPVDVPGVVTCVVSETTSGEFKIGNKTVPVSKPVLLQGGLKDGSSVLVPAADGNTLSKTALPVPGGIIGIELLGPLTSVTATAELAGPVELDVVNANQGKGVAAILPLKVKLDNPLLLNACYIGSDSQPMTPQLTTGTTNPPPPNGPISGSPGTPVIKAHGKIVVVENSSLVDNAFAVPGANGCAGPLALLVDPAVDLQTGLPAAAGHNTAILSGHLAAAGARAVKAQRLLPDLGRCQKVTGEKVGKVTNYHGGYIDSACIEQNPFNTGKYEWVPGPGLANKFTGTSGTATLETVGKAKVKCAGTHSAGEYTGPKAATMDVTLTGCKLAANNEACQSAGSASGEITAKALAAQLGFIKNEAVGTELLLSLGWDLKHEPSIVTAECGASKESLQVTGSVIAPIGTLDKMTASYPLKFSATGGKQAPEAFEEGPKDTLSATIGSGPSEQAGLTASAKITNEEKLEFKADTE